MFENGDFFLQFGLTSTRIWWKRQQKHTFFFSKTLPEWRASFVHVDGRKGKFSKTVSVMHHTAANALEGMLSYFHSFSVLCGRAKTILIRYVRTRIFRKWRRNSFSKISRYVWTRPQVYALKTRRLSWLTYLHGSSNGHFREDFIPIPKKYQEYNS